MKVEITKRISLSISLSLMIGLFSLFILSSIGFIFGLSINLSYMLMAIVLAVFIPIRFYKFKEKEALVSLTIMSIIILLSAIISNFLLDVTYDGQWYHQTSIIFLKKGWNPITTNAKDFLDAHWNVNVGKTLIFVNSYPKFYEICAANIFYLTGNIETGKLLNWLSLSILFFYAYYVLGENILKKQPKTLFLGTFALVCNPVVAAQMFSYYTDAVMYCFMMIMILAILDIEQSQNNKNIKVAVSMLTMSAICLSNIKIACIGYTIAILLIYVLYLAMLKNWKTLKIIKKSLFLIAFLIFCTGINPYITNLKNGKHVFYPIAGAEKIDVMTHNIPLQFQNKSMPYKLFMSTFSRVDNNYAINKKIELKLPFTFTQSEIRFLKTWDTRESGFGIFWSGIIIISIILAGLIRHKNKKTKKIYALMMGILITTVILNPENWWARYVPQFYAIPVIIGIFCLSQEKNKLKYWMGCALLFFIVLNSMITQYIVLRFTYNETQMVKLEKEKMHQNKEFVKKLETNEIEELYTARSLLYLEKYGSKQKIK